MIHSAAMQKALDNVADTAIREARMFAQSTVPTTMCGFTAEKVMALADFFQEQTGLDADQIGVHRRVLVLAPDMRSAVNAVKAHGFTQHFHPGRIIYAVPGGHQWEGCSRDLPWTIVSAPIHRNEYWSLYERLRARLDNDPCDMRVAFARAGII